MLNSGRANVYVTSFVRLCSSRQTHLMVWEGPDGWKIQGSVKLLPLQTTAVKLRKYHYYYSAEFIVHVQALLAKFSSESQFTINGPPY